jgi:hypothetical protein
MILPLNKTADRRRIHSIVIVMKLTNKDKARAAKYRQCKPKQFGNLHERMQYVMALLNSGDSESSIGYALRTALYDLETEVKFYEPQDPPYGRRSFRIGR